MNRPADVDRTLEDWLAEGPSQLPAHVIDGIVRQLDTTHQRKHWWLPRRNTMTRSVLALGGAAVVVMAVALTLNYANLPRLGGPATLPATPDGWSRVLIETPSGTGRVVSLAASPHGLLAVVGEDEVGGNDVARLAVSTDGRTWTLVPEGRHPLLSNPRSFGYPSVVGTDRGFLMVQLDEVWMSENGDDWRRLASSATDPDLGGGPDAATVGGPGLVAVGGEKAWYSVDGSDWSLAAVPALPEGILGQPERYVGMAGVTAAGNDLVAWGIASVRLADNSDEHLVVPLLWASRDGRTWTDVVDPLMSSVNAVAGGPYGFVAAGQGGADPGVWFSADGQAWQRIAGDAFDSRWPTRPDGLRINNDPGDIPIELTLASAAAGLAGYIVVGGDGLCVSEGFCGSDEAVIWTSADGRSWSRVPTDDRFSDGYATVAIAWGSRFVVGGVRTDRPAIWISDSGEEVSGANASTAPAPANPTPTPSQPVSLEGSYQATDPPPDSSHLAMELIALPNSSYEVTIRDEFASVCGGASST
jgi:hypothetical protein